MNENDKPTFDKDLYNWLWNYSLNYLARFEVSQNKLEFKLRERREKYPLDVSVSEYNKALNAVITKLLEQNLLSDERYGQSRIRQLYARGKATNFIKQDLRRNGLDEFLIEDLLAVDNDEIYSPDEIAALRYIKKRKFGCYRKDEADFKQKQKELAALARQGFSYDLASRMLALELDEAEEIMLRQN